MIGQRVWDTRPFVFDFIDGEGEDLVISFSSVGHDPDRLPSPEFVGTASGQGGNRPPRRALFVMDEARSWANDPGFPKALLGAVGMATQARPARRIVTIGLSMGAYAALAAAHVLPVSAVLAFGPQSLLGSAAGEPRWARWTDQLPPLRWPCPPMPPPGTWACLVHGLQDDHRQAQGFPLCKGTDHLLFDQLGHSGLVPHLKARGALAGLLDAALAGDRRRLLRIASATGGTRRRTADISLPPPLSPEAAPSSP